MKKFPGFSKEKFASKPDTYPIPANSIFPEQVQMKILFFVSCLQCSVKKFIDNFEIKNVRCYNKLSELAPTIPDKNIYF